MVWDVYEWIGDIYKWFVDVYEWAHGDFLNGALPSAKGAINSIYTPFCAASLLITSISDSLD